MNYFDILPNEIFNEILLFLPYNCRGINKFWRTMCDNIEYLNIEAVIIRQFDIVNYVVNSPGKIIHVIYKPTDEDITIMHLDYNYICHASGLSMCDIMGHDNFKQFVANILKSKFYWEWYPSLDIINYTVTKHPLNVNIEYIKKRLEKTIDYYLNIIKNSDYHAAIEFLMFVENNETNVDLIEDNKDNVDLY
jgi:hypothetical protein